MTTRFLAAALGALVLAGAGAPAVAQPQPAPAAAPAFNRIPAAERGKALDEIRAIVSKFYVFPERRAAIVERLTEAQAAGRYDLDDPFAFASAVSADLAAASHDRHMYINVDPVQYAAATAPSASDDGSGQGNAFWRNLALENNHGLTEMKVLPGNIRYLKLAPFYWVDDESGRAYDDAMRFLRGGEAVIIDLRGNGGGNGAGVQYLTSHFLAPDTLLQTFHLRGEAPAQSRTLFNVPAGRLIGKPLYVLIDGGVASAGEEFAYHIEQFHLGELIGATTAGAANNNELMPVAPGFILSVSTGRPVHAISGTNWEGVGVAPTIATPPAQALEVAQSRALARLAASDTATAEQKARYSWLQQTIEAKLHPVTLAPGRMKALAGRYGEQVVTFHDGALWLARGERPERRLIPLAADGPFLIEGADLLRVRLTGSALELVRPGGAPPSRFARG